MLRNDSQYIFIEKISYFLLLQWLLIPIYFDFFFFCPLQTERTLVRGGNQMEITTAFKLVEMVNVPRLMAIDVLFSRRRLRIE